MPPEQQNSPLARFLAYRRAELQAAATEPGAEPWRIELVMLIDAMQVAAGVGG